MKEYLEDRPENAKKFADGFVGSTQKMTGVTLDYSPGSVIAVEMIIDAMIRDKAPIHQMTDTFFSMGCYIGEVFVRNGYGQWVATHSTPMKTFSSAPFILQLSATAYCNPIDKVAKRVENGPEDSLAQFVETFSAKARPMSKQKSFWQRLIGR